MILILISQIRLNGLVFRIKENLRKVEKKIRKPVAGSMTMTDFGDTNTKGFFYFELLILQFSFVFIQNLDLFAFKSQITENVQIFFSSHRFRQINLQGGKINM